MRLILVLYSERPVSIKGRAPLAYVLISSAECSCCQTSFVFFFSPCVKVCSPTLKPTKGGKCFQLVRLLEWNYLSLILCLVMCMKFRCQCVDRKRARRVQKGDSTEYLRNIRSGNRHTCLDANSEWITKWLLGLHGAICGSLRYKGGQRRSNTRNRDGYLYRHAATSLK